MLYYKILSIDKRLDVSSSGSMRENGFCGISNLLNEIFGRLVSLKGIWYFDARGVSRGSEINVNHQYKSLINILENYVLIFTVVTLILA